MKALIFNRARRRFSTGIAVLAAAKIGLTHAAATPNAADPFQQRINAASNGAPIREGRVRIDTPSLADNGHSVPIIVKVESPMTVDDYVRRIRLVSENNPRPLVATFHLSPRSGRAEISTRIRLNKTQRVVALAEMSDGTCWSAQAEVIVTESACLDAD